MIKNILIISAHFYYWQCWHFVFPSLSASRLFFVWVQVWNKTQRAFQFRQFPSESFKSYRQQICGQKKIKSKIIVCYHNWKDFENMKLLYSEYFREKHFTSFTILFVFFSSWIQKISLFYKIYEKYIRHVLFMEIANKSASLRWIVYFYSLSLFIYLF